MKKVLVMAFQLSNSRKVGPKTATFFLLERRQWPGAEVVEDELCILEAAEAQCT